MKKSTLRTNEYEQLRARPQPSVQVHTTKQKKKQFLRTQSKRRQIFSFACVLLLLVVLLKVFYAHVSEFVTELRRTMLYFEREKYSLQLVLISSRFSDFSSHSWTLALALRSFLRSFELPDERIHLSLSVYLQCSLNSRYPLFDETSAEWVHEDFTDYVSEVKMISQRFSRSFSTVAFHCAGTVASAFCHLSQSAIIENKQYFFVLEHDWILLPSQIKPNAYKLMKAMGKGGHEYALLQRGDRESKHYLSRSLGLRRSRLYSNNPFMARSSFFHKLASNEMICRRSKTSNFEHGIETFCKKKCNIVLLESVKRAGLSIYHVDGKLLSFARSVRAGLLLDPAFSIRTTLETSTGINISFADLDAVTGAVDTICRDSSQICDPYYMRNVLTDKLETFVRHRGCVTSPSFVDVAASYFGSFEKAQEFTVGHFPKKLAVEALFASLPKCATVSEKFISRTYRESPRN